MIKYQIGIKSWITSEHTKLLGWSYSASHNEVAKLTVSVEVSDYSVKSYEDRAHPMLDLTEDPEHPLYATVGGVTSVNIETVGKRLARVDAVFNLKQFYTSHEDAAAAEMQERMENSGESTAAAPNLNIKNSLTQGQ